MQSMKLNVLMLSVVAAFTLGCAHSGSEPEPAENAKEQVTTFTRGESDRSVSILSSYGGSDIKTWRVIDDSTMIIETYRHGDLVATFFSPCPGLKFTEVLGFSTMGPFDLDKTTRVILPDGRWCSLKELKPYVQMETPSED